MVFPRITWQQ